ncbi:uncharacterized protein BDW43DRAFT_276941 [Aspergillus alliaceus]|uniref:uncharacterized protein n=1 Tax=Petromyces alliaceus TaxID=209559 RepID=UPI0012A75205|nr:uncharacterized protein BDW43DRAFT_276941 [Aspergillus alliaceus]KAB8233308.1 hypothetical protein BDW43DRAFT_276941 [Aspergillus alliaceus]
MPRISLCPCYSLQPFPSSLIWLSCTLAMCWWESCCSSPSIILFFFFSSPEFHPSSFVLSVTHALD